MNNQPPTSSRARPRAQLGTVLGVAAVLAGLGLFWSASENHYRACVEKAAAKYPAVPVSAFVGKDKSAVGPLKVSFVRERDRAVSDCHHIF